MEQPTPDAPAQGSAPEQMPAAVAHAGLRYTFLRLAVLAVVGGALYLAGARGWQLAVLAVLLSGLISLFALNRQRNEAAANIERSMRERSARQRAAEEAEDAAADARAEARRQPDWADPEN